ncbi:hypothetical protein [Gynuella sunshinyii]|nr:hypothetical protein [Gynuella sunshinyii]
MHRNKLKHALKVILPLLLLPGYALADTELKPFTTDGCSVFPDGTPAANSKWIECCIRHDYAYWKGGTFEQREQADAALEQCVSDMGESGISILMHAGVRLGGSPYFPTWYRWGYGWPMFSGYKALTTEEQQQVQRQLQVFHNLIGTLVEENVE